MRTVDFGAEQNTFEPEDGAGAKEYLDEDPAEILGVRQSENGPVESQKDAAVAAARSHEVGVLMLEDIHPPAAQAKQPERQQAIDAGESDDPKSSAAGASEGGEGGSGHPPENTTTFDDGESGREDGDDAEKVDRVESAADYPYLREVSGLIEAGIQETPFAWHGTSVEAIEFLAKHGHLPATGTDGNEFFYAPEGYADKGDSQENHAKFYAEWNGAKQYILDNLPYTPRNLNDLMYSQDNEECKARIIAEAHENGVPLTERGLEDLWLDGRHMRPGVTIAISQDIERDHEKRTPIDRNQRSVMTQNGLLLKYIVGIEPMGNYEWERLQRLQDLLDDSPPE